MLTFFSAHYSIVPVLQYSLFMVNMDEGTLSHNFNYGQADRPISISMLNTLRRLHT